MIDKMGEASTKTMVVEVMQNMGTWWEYNHTCK